MEEDAKSVAKMLRQQIASLMRDREEKHQKDVEVASLTSSMDLHEQQQQPQAEQPGTIHNDGGGQISTQSTQPVFIQQPIMPNYQQVLFTKSVILK